MLMLGSVTWSDVVVNVCNLFHVVLVVIGLLCFTGCGRVVESEVDSDTSLRSSGAAVSASDSVQGAQDSNTAGNGAEIDLASEPTTRKAVDQGGADAVADEKIPAFYSVPHYDEAREPAADLQLTIKRAQQGEKRILVQVGGDWCNWCGRLAEFMAQKEKVRGLLEQHFLIMKVASESKYTDAFLSDYPKINSYPHVFVLNAKGELLHSQDMEELERGEGYDEVAFLKFLQAWVPVLREQTPDDLPE
ncbi:thioredoxin family protein [bacterium]|nr:thioredoxin family protein [bacterium]